MHCIIRQRRIRYKFRQLPLHFADLFLTCYQKLQDTHSDYENFLNLNIHYGCVDVDVEIYAADLGVKMRSVYN